MIKRYETHFTFTELIAKNIQPNFDILKFSVRHARLRGELWGSFGYSQEAGSDALFRDEF